MVYLKSSLAGLLATLAVAILTVIIVVVYLSIASRSSEHGAVGWDPISIAKPWSWFGIALGIFLAGFFWEFFRLPRK